MRLPDKNLSFNVIKYQNRLSKLDKDVYKKMTLFCLISL